MKEVLLAALILVFSVGAIVPAAFAFECGLLSKQMNAEVMVDMGADMPCHETNAQNTADQNNKHCDGICMCLALSVMQNQIFQTSSVLEHSVSVGEIYGFADETMRSSSPLPLYKPPIYLA